MDSRPTSYELLAHFDHVVDDAPDVVPIAAADDAPPAIIHPARGTRGVGWVLSWFAALVVLWYSTSVLAEFAYCVWGEQLLFRAARAGALEATLPQASAGTIHLTVWRRLQERVTSPGDLKLSLFDNDVLVGKQWTPTGGDRLTVALAMPAQAVMPRWVRALTWWRGDTMLEARAERSIPGRTLRPQTSAKLAPGQ